MHSTLQHRLLQRELNGLGQRSSISGLYGHPYWIDNLDIVNELGGHHGCVNALSWSKSGQLLASGSDDTNLLIHRYLPEDSIAPFSLSTSISTGHGANIFSVKFMPHSNDRTLVTAAGDHQIRVFDVEYSGRGGVPNRSLAPSGGSTYKGVRYLNEGNTNARIYRSHADRVKRIVTESSPYLFLSCSEDGEVRQWDLRLPSSAYPPPRRAGINSLRHSYMHSNGEEGGNVPPPLISYANYRVDLNTISCSANQPHYIVLGGAHLHCFLHDRRMLGRDKLLERGSPASTSSSGENESNREAMMGRATRCVRRFAPHGQKKMGRTSNGHVTACKISDANPNEMIASWSGDHIYSFDLIRSPDADEEEAREPTLQSKGKAKKPFGEPRKRKQPMWSETLEAEERSASRPRRLGSPVIGNEDEDEDISLRVRYANGQHEDFAIHTSAISRTDSAPDPLESALNEKAQRAFDIAKDVVKIRKLLFSSEAEHREVDSEGDNSSFKQAMNTVLVLANSCLPEMEEAMRSYTYPVDPDEWQVGFQKRLRAYRDRARRFVQAAGTLANVLEGPAPGLTDADLPMLSRFLYIQSSPLEVPTFNRAQTFRYDFLRAICAWLLDGRAGILKAFQQNEERKGVRYPVPEDAGLVAIDEIVLPYLQARAGNDPIPNVDTSRFELDENRFVFRTELEAVMSFSRAITLAEPVSSNGLSGSEDPESDTEKAERKAAKNFWGYKVAKGLLLNAAKGVDFHHSNVGFGGYGGLANRDEDRNQIDISITPDPDSPSAPLVDDSDPARDSTSDDTDVDEETPMGVEFFLPDDEDDHDDADGDGPLSFHPASVVWQSTSDRARLRAEVDLDVPVNSHTRVYRGHCNVKTVKDVNFFGLDDEYVVSGSDSGHLFIWDKKTCKLMNILEGDGEVVNVIQGHPYEPMLAVSGIDHTIKIFSPDARAQRDARFGINLGVSASGSSGSSTLHWPRLRRSRQRPQASGGSESEFLAAPEPHQHPDDAESDLSDDAEYEDLVNSPTKKRGLSSRKRMHDSYNILAQNDVERQGGMRDAHVTRNMLEQLALHMQLRTAAAAGAAAAGADAGEGQGDEGGQQPQLDENCQIM